MEALITQLSSMGGPFGVVAAIFVALYIRKDRELRTERERFDKDMRQIWTEILVMKDRDHQTVDKLSTIADLISRGLIRR